ncbi:cell division protein FtsQ [Limosilactobacillus coleohominis 101-4-CHN]|uniref:Cell division protein DivIB n=1 Tax=Limosilactobacillus coleohominis 101-4-CHN TaxID=575594 RepID=C7XTD3_9LACO|nr:FtsQ-type POTRA domain-containing protein [Limosilactobacillus coleohominis]EEU30613.1 cell division protein FtsQ [Limosilactobacillus coleohominis 101-4-CHN]
MSHHYDDNDDHQRYLQRLKKLENSGLHAIKEIRDRETSLNNEVPAVGYRQKVGNGKRAASILIPFILVLLIAIYMLSPLSKIETVRVEGNTEMTSREVQKATNIRSGRYIWWIFRHQGATLEQAQKRNPQIKTLRIKLTGPRSVRVRVTEYPVIGIINHDGRQQLLLSNGKYRPITGKIDNFLHYANFNNSYTHLKIAAREIGTLPKYIRQSISEVSYSPTKLNPDRLKLIMNDGNTVLVRADTLGEKMKYYPSIVSKMKGNGIIDLQYGAYSYNYGNKQK